MPLTNFVPFAVEKGQHKKNQLSPSLRYHPARRASQKVKPAVWLAPSCAYLRIHVFTMCFVSCVVCSL